MRVQVLVRVTLLVMQNWEQRECKLIRMQGDDRLNAMVDATNTAKALSFFCLFSEATSPSTIQIIYQKNFTWL